MSAKQRMKVQNERAHNNITNRGNVPKSLNFAINIEESKTSEKYVLIERAENNSWPRCLHWTGPMSPQALNLFLN
ncbi:hypothetical protein ACTXT7_014075 [Hymenolepis weldensis]